MDGVAIIGMAGRFPGARDVGEFWRNIEGGVESISRFATDELEPCRAESPGMRKDPNYVPARGVLPGAELFDAAFFGINPTEAAVMDPQQRVFLETAWTALEDAGYDPRMYRGAIGVWAGMSNNTYFLENLYPNPAAIQRAGGLLVMMGNEKDYLATRVAYKLDLRGPCVSVYTACSTSLVAVCQAVQALIDYQCDTALAGGVSITFPQQRGYLYQEGAITSPDGHCRAFDVEAAGTVFSNGVGIVVLKRLADALADGDNVYAVIKGAALNNDGATKVSFTAPSVDGQAECIALAQSLAGVEPETISLVEAHGTATPLGDPVEIAALTQAFRAGTSATRFCAVGSVKTNIGHLDAAAGIVGLIKAAMALRHRKIPPSLHFTAPNPKLDLENSPFYVATRLADWPPGGTPRRAGVSSFGVGGTNAHVVLEEAPTPPGPAPARREQLLVISARTASALEQATANLARCLETSPGLDLADVAFTLQAGRRRFAHRRMLVCRDGAEAITSLRRPEAEHLVSTQCDARAAPVVFLFPGQGAQRVNMARGLYQGEAAFRTAVDECAETLQPELGLDLRTVLYPDAAGAAAAAALLEETRVTQPALFAIEYALADLWMRWGVKPQAMIGHSLGEYVAACLAGVLSREDALRVVAERARLMQSMPGGVMLAVRLPAVEVEPLLSGTLSVAALNGPAVTVVAGNAEAVQALEAELGARGVAFRRLPTSHAFHSSMMDSVLKPFEAVMRGVRLKPPQVPWVSGVTGQWITAAEAMDAAYWARQLRQPVRFADGVALLVREGSQLLLEVGPGRSLTALARQHTDRSAGQTVIASLPLDENAGPDIESILDALGRLWIAGADIDWAAVHDGQRRRRLPLPTYPFERQRFWIDPPTSAERAPEASPETVTAVGMAGIPTAAADDSRSEESMADTPVEVTPTPGRHAILLGRVRALFAELSGIDAAALDHDTPFVEAGLDSLSLTQASAAIQKAFGVKISFRQLLEDLASPGALADWLDRTLPPDPSPAASVRVPVSSTTESSEVVPRGSAVRPESQEDGSRFEVPRREKPDAAVGSVEWLVAQQLELMSRQLDLLRSGAPAASADGGARATPERPPDGVPVSPAYQAALADSASQESRAFGPYRPIDKGTGGGLTPSQQRSLEAFITRYTARTQGSKRLAEQHRRHLADPRSVAGFRLPWKEAVYPIVTVRSAGSKLWDVDGNEYVDLTNGFGMVLFGHAPPFVTAAVEAQLRLGFEIGPQSPLAGEVARRLCAFTGMDRAAFCNTGSEAVMAAIRLARTVTGRDRIAMFAGAYHGVFDEVLVRPTLSDGVLRSRPIAPGIPAGMADNVIVLEYGQSASLDLLRAQAGELAAVLVEPVQSRRPDLQPWEFLRELRELTASSGTALICDEVVTGFRAHPGGVQAMLGIQGDLATYGKVIGGGLPIGIVTGRREFMDALDGGMWQYGDLTFPEVGVTFFAGTFVRHPLALAAARACLIHLEEEGPELQRRLNERTTRLVEALRAVVARAQAPIRLTHFSSFFCIGLPPDYPFAPVVFAWLRAKGLHVWEGRPAFLTTAHSDEDIDRVVQAFAETVAEMQEVGLLPTTGPATPPLPGARRGRDPSGREAWFIPDPDRPGKYLQVGERR
jgi:acyl transferase domain-containing protein/glutamate-1-semialdehyde aminotransferase